MARAISVLCLFLAFVELTISQEYIEHLSRVYNEDLPSYHARPYRDDYRYRPRQPYRLPYENYYSARGRIGGYHYEYSRPITNKFIFDERAYCSWNFKHQSDWDHRYRACKGVKQSPINIDLDKLGDKDDCRKDVEVNGVQYNSVWVTAINHGRFLRVKFRTRYPVYAIVNHGPRTGKRAYRLAEEVFIWSRKKHLGSNHYINGKGCEAERNIIFYNSKYRSLKEASKELNGLFVLAVGIDAESRKDVPAWSHLLKALRHIRRPYAERTFYLKDLSAIFPSLTHGGYLYEGSLMFPPCTENVQYLVLKETNKMSRRQLEVFKGLYDLRCDHDDGNSESRSNESRSKESRSKESRSKESRSNESRSKEDNKSKKHGLPYISSNRKLQSLNERDVCEV